MLRFKYIAFIFCLMAFKGLLAQESIMQFHTSATYHYGFIIAHRPNVEVLVKDYIKATEFSFEKRMTGKEDWEQKYAYPYVGVSFSYYDFGNPEQLGQGLSLFAYCNFPIIYKESFELNFKLGFGPGYVEKVFDKRDNYKNQTVSTHFNGFAFGNLIARYTLAERYTLNAGISISHFSNASASKPNLGINMAAINAGIGYRFSEKEKTTRGPEHLYNYPKKWDHDLIASGGRKSNEIEGNKHAVFSLAYAASRHVSYKSKFGGGADFFYNSAHEGKTNSEGDSLQNSREIAQLGLNASYTLQFSKLGLIFNMGFYIYDKYKDDGAIYNRVGMRYLVNDHFILNLTMKTHFAVADHVELGLGYRF